MTKEELTIARAEHLGGHLLRFHFSDGHQNDVDFKPWIKALPTKEEQAYLKPARFKRFTIRSGHAIMWGEYDIIFPMEAVYHGDPDLIGTGVPVRAVKLAGRIRQRPNVVRGKASKARSPLEVKAGRRS